MKKILLPLILCASLMAGCANENVNKDEVPELSPRSLYIAATNYMASGDWTRARQYLEAMDQRFPFGELSEQVQLDLIYVYYKSRESEMTTAQINRYLRLSPTSQYVDYVLYMRGLNAIQKRGNILQEFVGLNRAQKDPTEYFEALKDFKELIETYPESIYAPDARQRMLFIKEQLAQRELMIARYYHEREAFLSSARHCQTILFSYRETPYLHDALVLLRDNYERLHLDTPAINVQRVIDASFN